MPLMESCKVLQHMPKKVSCALGWGRGFEGRLLCRLVRYTVNPQTFLTHVPVCCFHCTALQFSKELLQNSVQCKTLAQWIRYCSKDLNSPAPPPPQLTPILAEYDQARVSRAQKCSQTSGGQARISLLCVFVLERTKQTLGWDSGERDLDQGWK